MSSSSQGLNFIGTLEPVALFLHQNRLNQDAFSEREQLVDVLGRNESIFRFSDPANVALLETEITCLLKRDLNS